MAASGLVLRVSGWEVLVADDASGQEHLCQLRGRVKAGPRRPTGQIVAGDRVDWQATEPGRGVVERIQPRRNHVSRTASGNRPQQQVMLANVDRYIVVVAARHPPLQPGFIDRALVVAASGGVEGVLLCINKTDLDPDDERAPVVDLYRDIGVDVLETSAETGAGVSTLEAHLHRGLSVFVGPSGAGKSSLLNRIEPGLALRTQELMRHHDRGRHTTTSSCLHPLQQGGWLADTPGVKQLEPWGIGARELIGYFPEMDRLPGDCQFRDCTHLHEPGCRVRDAVDEGQIAASRYQSFCRIQVGDDS